MSEPLAENWQRMRWARTRAGFATAKDAADRIGLNEITYRSYEKPVADGGRWPRTTDQVRRIARVLRVSWVWLETGSGEPNSELDTDDVSEFLASAAENAKVIEIPRREEAMRAALSVLQSYRKRDTA